MPTEFYGGANPVIKFKPVEKEISLDKSAPTRVERAVAEKKNAVGGESRWHPANLLSDPKTIVLFAGGIFLLFILGGAVYYYFQSKQPAPIPRPEVASVVVPTPVVVEEIATAPAPTTTTTSTVEEPSLPAEASIEFPTKILGDSADMDKDGLTDEEETLYGTDPAVPDTDDDSYNDSHEVFYLYDPTAPDPSKLIDAGHVSDFANPVTVYKVFYPSLWSIGNVDSQYEDVLFSAVTGENIEIRIFNERPGETFTDWFSRMATGEQYADLESFTSMFGATGWSRIDHLVFYFEADHKVYVFAYHPGDAGVANFRAVITMMARSFRLPVLPEAAL